MISLATPRLVLRPWTDADMETFVELCTDPEVMAFIGDGSPRTRAEAEARFARLVPSWEADGFGLLAIEEIDTGAVAGFVGLGVPDFLPEMLPSVEVGWRLLPSFWGRGLGTEAAAAMVDWAVGQPTIDEVIAIIRIENSRSHRIAAKLGMDRRRRTIIPGHRVWVDVYGVSAAQWAQHGGAELEFSTDDPRGTASGDARP